jgi:hypothetical protein
MKSLFEKITLIVLIFILITGCKKNYSISDKQEILFQLEYVSNVRGNQHNGFIIDNGGNVLTYSNPENWNFPDNDFSLNERQVSENVSKCVPSGKKISKEELQKYTKYIKNIASSKVTALKKMASNAGSLEFICYMFSVNTGTYKGYLIKKEGDFTCENLNFYSKKVTAWMRDINNKITEK